MKDLREGILGLFGEAQERVSYERDYRPNGFLDCTGQAYNAEKRRRFAEHGLCVECGLRAPSRGPRGGLRRCDICREVARKRYLALAAKRAPWDKPDRSEYYRVYYLANQAKRLRAVRSYRLANRERINRGRRRAA
jgi:hypothetical protein